MKGRVMDKSLKQKLRSGSAVLAMALVFGMTLPLAIPQVADAAVDERSVRYQKASTS